MWIRYASLVLIATPLACGGELFILESQWRPGGGDADRPCTIAEPDGVCPDDLSCCSGVCVSDCGAWPCDCEPGQACVSGECEEITEENACSATNQDGLCPMTEICIGGTCVPISIPCGDCEPEQACVDGECLDIPAGEECAAEQPEGLCPDGELCFGGVCIDIDNGCSTANPTGLCPPGATCVAGRCVVTGERPCGPGALDGLCPSCQACVAPGVCELLSCSASAPQCACPNPDEYCDAGECACLPCSANHLQGCCAEDSFCSAAGLCIADGGCAHPDDCRIPNTFCSCDSVCINTGTCLCDVDCGLYHECDTGDFVCVRDLDCPNGDADCPTDEFCDSAAICRLDGTCAVDNDCTEAGDFCSSCNECVAAGSCCTDDDCVGEQFCSSANTCLNDGQCAATVDCPPGNLCNDDLCELGNDTCSSNGSAGCVTTGDDTFWCCADPDECCAQGERCSAEGTCIPDGECINDSDCYFPHFTCVAFACAPANPCTGDDCAGGQTCSHAGGCIPDDGGCGDDDDCPDGEVCNALFACEPATGCGNQEFEATLIPPNMLIVLDRSGSMRDCVPPSADSRWNVARDALNSVVTANSDTIRFGVSTYPMYCPGSTVCAIDSCWDDPGDVCQPGAPCNCSNDCDWAAICQQAAQPVCEVYPPCVWNGSACEPRDTAIADGNNRVPGDVDVPVGDDAQAVLNSLAPPTGARGLQHPGGYTPTGRTLRNIASQLDTFGLPDPNDVVPRDNFIMLVTDGEANSPGGTYGAVCNGMTSSEADNPMPPIECALDTLRSQDPAVRTFAVGFIGTARAQMNCMAVHGGTSRCATPSECAAIADPVECAATLACAWSASCTGGVDDGNCATTTHECYFRANNAQELNDAFATIAGEIASCSYSLDQIPPELDNLYVYFYYECGDIGAQGTCNSTPGCAWAAGSCDGDPVRLARDDIDGWDYDSPSNQILFAGAACDLVKAGDVTPVVILGCCTGEGC